MESHPRITDTPPAPEASDTLPPPEETRRKIAAVAIDAIDRLDKALEEKPWLRFMGGFW